MFEAGHSCKTVVFGHLKSAKIDFTQNQSGWKIAKFPHCTVQYLHSKSPIRLPRSVHTSQNRMFFVISKVGITTHELSDELHDDAADDFYAFYGFGRIIEICLIVIRICPSIVAFRASSLASR